MDYHGHKKYFETAYKTGTDVWTNANLPTKGLNLLEKLPKDALVLDLGSGRGTFARQMAEMGFRVIGIDFEENIVEKANSGIKGAGLEGKLKFVASDVLDIPFTDASFAGVCDFGLLQHLYKEDWPKYASEVARVLKPGGFYLNVSLARQTPKFYEFSPIKSSDGEFEKYGVHFHFFERDEIKNVFTGKLKVVSQEILPENKSQEGMLLETLFQK